MAKRHNWVTGPNHKVVDREADRLAQGFICGCNHLTPAAEAELDELFAEMNRNAPEANEQTVCEPDKDVLDAMENPVELELEPPTEAYEYDRRTLNRMKETHQAERNDMILEARAAFEA